ncbi:MAG: LPS-assembly protein LptD [Rhodospirillaceae bacterium]|nr:LPS-assembly protein LptD [Rhodospirillaceae bacterium]
MASPGLRHARILVNRVGPVILLAFALLPGGSPETLAQEPTIGKQPVVITADNLRHDEQGGRTVATGNVQVTQGDRTVRADRVVYDRRAGRVTALGNVSIAEPGGETVFGDRVVLSEDVRDGVIERFRMLFPDGSRLAANGATRTGGRKTEMTRVVFSPCKLCQEDPTKAPLWRLKARRVIHDWKTRDIEYRDAWLEIYGLPVFYSPYFSHPDPTVERRSGFLAPTFGTGKQRGAWIRTPYYWRIGRDRDATLTPLVSTQENPVLFMEYRERIERGAIFLSGSYTSTSHPNPDVRPVFRDRSRGHFFGKIRYDIDKYWRIGVDGNWSADDTYLRRYDVANADSLESSAWLEGFHDRNYTAFRLHHFQGLRVDDSYRKSPLVAPYIEHERFGATVPRLGRWHFGFSTASLTRWEGADSYRTTINLGWRLPHIHKPTGLSFVGKLDLFADGYYVAEVDRPAAARFNGFAGRFHPVAEAEVRYPLVRELSNVRLVVEPRAAVIGTTSSLNTSKIPNEDSVDFELDDANLFSANRYPGRDRVDDGSRFVYGVNAAFLGNRGGQSELFLGQSLRLSGSGDFARGSGLRNAMSDLVGRLRINPGQYLDLVYRFRLHPANFRAQRNEVTTFAGVPALNISASYLLFESDEPGTDIPSREEMAFAVRSGVTKQWTVFGGGRWNLGNDAGNLNWQVGGLFNNECCSLRLTLGQSFTRDRDIRPSTNFLFRLGLKHLGQIGG